MTDRNVLFRRMREALTALYPTWDSASALARAAGLNLARIERSERAMIFWYNILQEAEQEDKVEALLARAIQEHPSQAATLAALREAYRTLGQAKSPPAKPPPTRPDSWPPARPPEPATPARRNWGPLLPAQPRPALRRPYARRNSALELPEGSRRQPSGPLPQRPPQPELWRRSPSLPARPASDPLRPLQPGRVTIPPQTPRLPQPGPTPAYPPPAPQQAPELAQLRLDVGVPAQVFVQRAFDLAVAVRRSESPILSEADLERTGSNPFLVRWHRTRSWVRLRLSIDAPECEIEGEADQSFTLWVGQDSPVFYWHLTPRQLGDISIIVKVFEVKDWLGSARVHTSALEQQPSGTVRMVVHAEPLAPARLTLARALLRCAAVRDRQNRDAIVDNLPEELRLRVRRSDTPLLDVQNIIEVALNYQGGLAAFIRGVRGFEGDSAPMREVDGILTEAGWQAGR